MRGAGEPSGLGHWGEPPETGGAQALSARARQLTPQAFERECRLLFRNRLANVVVALRACGGLALGAGAAAAETPADSSGGASVHAASAAAEEGHDRGRPRVAPASAPERVKRVIEAANRIVEKPYRYGGGHRPFGRRLDTGYDCSGSVSYALYGGRFLRSPLPSGALMSWGAAAPAAGSRSTRTPATRTWWWPASASTPPCAIPTRPGPRTGPRWSKSLRRSAAFVARHPRGY